MASSTRPEILLESGTNELEVLVFTLHERSYGVNVAKVREVIENLTVTSLPESPDSVLGVFQLRDIVTPLIDLHRALKLEPSRDAANGKIIIMEFNDARIGFFVDTVAQIYRVSWADVRAVPDMHGVHDAPLTSIALIKDEMVPMIDFERLVFDISGVDLFQESAKKVTLSDARQDRKILLAEDSHVMRTLIGGNLKKSGYTDVTICNDGQEAWDALEADLADGGSLTYDLLITDIEMPRIDGLCLTKRIKEHLQLRGLPVIVFSSLVSIDNQKKCESVGANAQITKPQLAELVDLLDGLLGLAGCTAGNVDASAQATQETAAV